MMKNSISYVVVSNVVSNEPIQVACLSLIVVVLKVSYPICFAIGCIMKERMRKHLLDLPSLHYILIQAQKHQLIELITFPREGINVFVHDRIYV